ncbi:hypothetical protein, partial [Microbulbifer sp.]|uniref:hypothetical protein n=1 Tax=Microbulbifer sp. TaxID=1908541 RepID=UPI00258AC3D5
STTSCAASSLNSGSNRFFFDLVIISPELVERDNITQSQVAKFSVPLHSQERRLTVNNLGGSDMHN